MHLLNTCIGVLRVISLHVVDQGDTRPAFDFVHICVEYPLNTCTCARTAISLHLIDQGGIRHTLSHIIAFNRSRWH